MLTSHPSHNSGRSYLFIETLLLHSPQLRSELPVHKALNLADQPKNKNEQPEHTATDRKSQNLEVNVFHGTSAVTGGFFLTASAATCHPLFALSWAKLLRKTLAYVPSFELIPHVELADLQHGKSIPSWRRTHRANA
jgi:hypothetical protein